MIYPVRESGAYNSRSCSGHEGGTHVNRIGANRCASISRSSHPKLTSFDIPALLGPTLLSLIAFIRSWREVFIGRSAGNYLLAGLSPAVFRTTLLFSIMTGGAIIVCCRHSCRASIRARALHKRLPVVSALAFIALSPYALAPAQYRRRGILSQSISLQPGGR